MMHVVCLDRVEVRDVDVEARVIQRGKDAACEDEEDDGVDMAGNDKNGQKLKILSDDKLEWMHVDGVEIAA